MANPLDSLPPPSANPLDALPPPPAPPMTVGRATGLTARGVGTGVAGTAFGPAEVSALGHSVLNSLVSKIAGQPVNVPTSPLDMLPNMGPVLPYKLMAALSQKYLGTESPTAGLNELATKAGLPAPQTHGERMYTGTLAGLTGGGIGGVAAGARPVISALSGATAGAAQQGAAESGAGPVGQTIAGLAGAALPGGVKMAGQGLYRTLPTAVHAPAPRVTPPAGMPPENALPVSLGLKIEPAKGGGPIGQAAEGLTNPAITQRVLSYQNAPTVNARVGEDFGIPTASPAALDELMKAPSAVYDEFRGLGSQPLAKTLHPSIEEFMAYSPRSKVRAQNWVQTGQADSSELLDEIRQQRALGSAQINNRRTNPEQGIIGDERLDFANQLEQQLDQNLQARQDLPNGFLDLFRGARTEFAKIYSAKRALRGDNIFVGDLAKQQERGVPLSGNMKALADTWENHDRVLQDPGKIRSPGPLSFGDAMMGAATVGFHHLIRPWMWPALAARPAIRAGLTSDLYQKYGIRGGAEAQPPAPLQPFQSLVDKYNAQKMPTQQGELPLATPPPKPLQLTTPQAAPPLGHVPQSGAELLASKYGIRPLPAPRFQSNAPSPGPLGQGPLEPAATPFQYPDLAGAKPPSIVTGNPITDQFRQYLENHHDEARARYQAINDPDGVGSTLGGRVMSVDLARELSPHYVADRTLSDDVHEPGSDFIKKLYAERLAQPVEAAYDPSILFTAGGTGAGKTSAIKRIPHVHAMADKAHIIYDTNIARAASAIDKIDRGKQAGLDSHVAYVYRDPAEALQNGTLPRAERMGRTVPLETHNITHEGSGNSIQELRQHYATDPHVTFSSIDNSLGKGNAVLSPVDLPDGKRYSAPAEELKDVVEQAYQAGKIGPRTYQGTIRGATAGAAGQPDRANPGAAGGGGEVPSGDRPEPGGQPQPERAGQVAQFEAPGAAPSGRPILVARVGSSPSLVNRNAGSPTAIALHLARLEDVDRPQPAGVTAEGPQTLYVHEVTPQESFGAYQRGDRGEMQPGSLGRESGSHAVQYSFPEGAKYQSRVVTQIPLAELRAELKARTGTESFDDLGGTEGGRVLDQIIQDRIRAATMKGIPATKPRVRAYPSVTTTSGEPITLEQLRKKYGAER